ncbi:hypothetical protein G3M48_007395 [Beauveria asiatica]|uniref:Uncharacterized protein n=1 Tax=Beauveria asiatica TaxID=1069075 RepID=A0AAW0RM85_9HYPO
MTRIAASFCLSRNSGIYEMTLKMGFKIWNQRQHLALDPFRTVAVISRFTEDLAAHKDIDTCVFGAAVLFEHADSCSVRFNNVILSRLLISAASKLVGRNGSWPGRTWETSVWVADVDAEVARLKTKGVAILLGPETKP